jgi:hypothetical protein
VVQLLLSEVPGINVKISIIFSQQNVAKSLSILTQNAAGLYKNGHSATFQEKRQFFVQY